MATFPAIRIEGGLLGPDVLEQLLSADLPGQRAADFGLEARRNLTDEIAAAFADGRALWGVFQHRLQRVPADDPATTATRDAWAIPLLGLLGYEPSYNQRAYEVDARTFAISHRASVAEDSPPLHIVGARQDLGRVPASGRPRLAPHSLVQEFLNHTEYLWGIATNGLSLRLLRNCTFVRRQAYVEFDLQEIFEENRFHDFAAFYRLLHRSRLPRGLVGAGDCLLEQYYTHSVEQGGRVREHLRDGVEECIVCLGNGFLAHPANEELRRYVSPACTGNERITAEDLYRQLLRLVYRFLFLLVSEDRGLLGSEPLYHQHYGMGRLRRLVDRREAYTDHDDLWQSLRLLWRVLTKDNLAPQLGNRTMASLLGLPVLNGQLFERQDLDDYVLANSDLLKAFWQLAWYQESRTSPPRRVNYAALDVEELGSVYESLLEFHPAIDPSPGRPPAFRLDPGAERKTTGSYYTPPELVAELVKSALEPVLAERLKAKPKQQAKAILSLRVCDAACGSGHFLLAAARRLGKELARVQTGDDEPGPEHVRAAIREVVSHCIYGVDKNPLAVDLCRVALWLEGHNPDKPLTFLDHRIRCGDSIVGALDLKILHEGIPDKAFEARAGDDKDIARELLRLNRDERRGQSDLFTWSIGDSLAAMTRHSHEIDDIADDSPEEIRRKRQRFEQSHADPAWRRQKEACDLYTAAFFQPLTVESPVITSDSLAKHLAGRQIDPRILGQATEIALRQRFFHWPLEFPEVFAEGGFDVVLSNPPWERVKLQEQEFFAARASAIALAPNKAARTRLIRELPETNPDLYREFVEALRTAAGASAFMRHGGRYPLTGRGDINTYAVFAELVSSTINSRGRAGMVLPKGIATDDTTKLFFGSVVNGGRLVSLIGFENEEFIFPAVDHRVTFCVLTLAGSDNPEPASRIGFYIRRFSQLTEAHRFFTLDKNDFWLLNPNTGNCPIFRSQADAELTKAIYRRVPILWREATDDQPEVNPWRLSFCRLFDMANDSHHFRTAAELEADGYRLEGNVFVRRDDRYLPLYEAKMLHQFDHRFSTYEGATQNQLNVGILPQPKAEQKRDPSFVVQPRYWVKEEVVESATPKYPEPLAAALETGHLPSIKRVLALWAVGYRLNQKDGKGAEMMFRMAVSFGWDRALERWLANSPEVEFAANLERDFPLTEADVQTMARDFDNAEEHARELIKRFSPKWFLGWRDITNTTNERTVIASVTPNGAIGHTFPLFLCPEVPARKRILLLANLNSFVADYAARQKVGGTHITYNLLKQFALFPPNCPSYDADNGSDVPMGDLLFPRALELVYTANDLTELAQDCGYDGPPFAWDEDRRFEIRCELDAAFFHLYLPAEANGEWRMSKGETPEQLAALRKHFPTPRDAVAFILDQFPIVKEKDGQAHGRYRTKERILEIYDAMLVAQRTGRAYASSLNPPPGGQETL